jgi:hypothetical protein
MPSFLTPARLRDLSDEDLAAAAEALRAEQRRRKRSAGLAPRVSQRELALEALELAGVPATFRLLTALVEAQTGETLDGRRLASQRRDERNAWERDQERGRLTTPRLAPALHHERLEPVRAIVTVSTWPLAERIVTPISPRADRSRLIERLAGEALRLAQLDEAAAGRLAQLAIRYAATLPGGAALAPFGSDPVAMLDSTLEVAQLAWERVGRRASEERADAAERAAALPLAAQVWGNALSAVPKAGGASRRAARSR